MKRHTLVVILVVAAFALVAARPTLESLQAQVDGIGGREVVQALSPLDTASFKSVTAQCPAGKLAIGGGGRMTFAPGSGSVGQNLANSYPSADDEWSVRAVSPVIPTNAWQLIGYVICASL